MSESKPPPLRARIIRLLARENVLSYSPEPRSLAVGAPETDGATGEPG